MSFSLTRHILSPTTSCGSPLESRPANLVLSAMGSSDNDSRRRQPLWTPLNMAAVQARWTRVNFTTPVRRVNRIEGWKTDVYRHKTLMKHCWLSPNQERGFAFYYYLCYMRVLFCQKFLCLIALGRAGVCFVYWQCTIRPFAKIKMVE